MSTIDRREQYGESDEDDAETETIDTVPDGEKEPEETVEEPVKEESSDEESTEEEAAPEEEAVDDEPAKKQKELDALEQEKKALLNDIVVLRTERRGLKSEDVFVDKKKQETSTTTDLADIAEQDIKVIEKVVKSLGYVKKDEIIRETHQKTVDTLKDQWLATHPEYLPENDVDDKRWNSLQGVMKNLFEVIPSDARKITKMLDIAHKELHPEVPLPERSRASVDAAKEKISMSGKGGSSNASSSSAKKSSGSKIDTSFLKGFSDEEIAELTR